MVINARKTANVLLTGFSFISGSLWYRPLLSGMPVSVTAELTNHCNLGCPECFTGSGMMKREKGYMDTGLFTRIMDELSPYLLNVSLYFQGEPMMHQQLFDFIEKSRNIYSVVSTNGHFLTPENSRELALSSLNKIIISLDGTNHGTYVRYRRMGDFDLVKKGICNLSDAVRCHNSSLKIEIQYLVNRFNETGIPEIKRFSREVKASLKLKSMHILNDDKIEYWQPSQEVFRRYHYHGGKYSVKSSLPDRCLRLWLNPVITWDGKVVPCCFDKDATWVMGDLNSQSFREIWHGDKYNNFRRMILTHRKNISMCTNCTSGLHQVRY